MKRALHRELGVILVLALSCAGLFFIPGPNLLATPGGERARARVIRVDNGDLQLHGLLKFGSQKLEVEILGGPHRGQVFRAANELRAQM